LPLINGSLPRVQNDESVLTGEDRSCWNQKQNNIKAWFD
jgi:hypothetical protein